MKKAIYNIKAKKAGDVTLPESIFKVDWNADLMHQVVTSYFSNARTKAAKVKDRSEVRGADQKPWRQKGTGRARHGTIYSPIWRGGGVTHGPTAERSFKKKINKKMKNKALAIALTQKNKDKEILFVDAFDFSEPKTKEAKSILTSLSSVTDFDGLASKKKNAVLIILPEINEGVEKSFRNFGNVKVKKASEITPVDVLRYKYSVIVQPDEVIEILSSRVSSQKEEKEKKA